MKAKLWVANLAPDTADDAVEALFMPFGRVLEVSIDDDPDWGRPTVSALVVMADDLAAQRAIKGLHGQRFHQQVIAVSWLDEEDSLMPGFEGEDFDLSLDDWDTDWEDDWGDDPSVLQSSTSDRNPKQSQAPADELEWED